MHRTTFLILVLAAAFCALAAASPASATVPAYRHTHARHSPIAPGHSLHHARAGHIRTMRHSNTNRTAARHAYIRNASLRRPVPPRPVPPRSEPPRTFATRHARRTATRPQAVPDSARAAAPPDDPAPTPVSLRRHRRVPMPAPLTGSLASLERQNERTDAEGLDRILDDDDLNDRIAQHQLVPVPVSSSLIVNQDLPANRRYCRPWTARFLADIARLHDALFHQPLEVSSAVRTVAYQKQLMHVNGNAAAAEGDIVSPHLTGATIDIAKHNLTLPELAWMRTQLLTLERAGKIDVEEEFQQSCFHITVYQTYAPAPLRRRAIPGPELASRGR